jgi:hypothetical protein
MECLTGKVYFSLKLFFSNSAEYRFVVVLQMVYYIVNVVNKGELHDKNSFFYV